MIVSDTIIESLYYILKKIGKTDKLKLILLLYLSDKYSIIHFGRTITGDTYYATNFCLIGKNTKTILNFDFSILKEEKDYFLNLIEKVENYNFKAKEKDIPFNTPSKKSPSSVRWR